MNRMQPVSLQQNVLAEFLDRVWSGGEVERCGAYLAEAYTIRHDPGDPWDGRVLGLAEFKERVLVSRAPFPDQRFSVQQWFENPAGVAVTWLWEGAHRGDLPGYPATGRTLRMSGATIYDFDDRDRICGHWQVVDRLGFYRQLREDLTSPAATALLRA